MGRSDPPRAPRVRCVTRRRGASLRLEVGSQSLRQKAQVSCAIQDCRGGEEHRPGLHPSVLRLLFSGAWFRLEARTRAVLSRPRAHTALPRRKGSRPSAPPPASASALWSPRPGIFPSLKPPGAPRAGPRGRGRGPSSSVGARRGLVGFGEEEEEGVAITQTKPRRVPGTGEGSGPGPR